MEFTIADAGKKDIAPLLGYELVDIDIGAANNFTVRLPKPKAKALGIAKGMWLYAHGTEYGGVFTNFESETNSASIAWGGATFRGLMQRDIVTPAAGADYRVVSGEANAVIKTILGENASAGSVFTVPAANTGVTFANWRYPRYRDKLHSLTGMLASKNMKLKITADRGASGAGFLIVAEAVPIVDYSNLVEYSQNAKENVHIINNDPDVNHLICLGAGTLRDRLRVDLYLQADGTVGGTKHYTGVNEYVGVFSYGSEGEADKLREAGAKHLLAQAVDIGIEMTAPDFPFDVGDIVAGRDYDMGISVKNQIASKILRTDGMETTVEISVKGDDGDGEEEM
ncbi:MAG: siphovirus ReqiPepy6 Gp37-like family protein [Clostridiales Family XIII bacterium]|jgi:hypothetical protein|nr:siphovirus ReqiPepy6 Gp37-like family protein [Clostridiales Family XIII bacterium]